MTKPKADRADQKALMARRRAAERDIEIPAVVDQARRDKCAKNPELFMRTYFPELFYHEFNSDRHEMVTAFEDRIRYGGNQAVAAPRGGGKSTVARGCVLWGLVYGKLKFVMVICKNPKMAEQFLKNLRFMIERSPILAEDFPEVCAPVTALKGSKQRVHSQTVGGELTRMTWSNSLISLAHIPGSCCAGAKSMAEGIDGTIRGQNEEGVRPDLVVIDDPDTKDSAKSEVQTADRVSKIEEDCAGLAGPGKLIAMLMLCTTINDKCVAAIYTDPKRRPAWNGKRYKLLEKKPDHETLWDDYIQLYRDNMENDNTGRKAMALYIENRKKMDAGAIASDPERYIRDKDRDGSPLEISALQHIYNIIAKSEPDKAWDHFNAEYQNDPPKEEKPEESGISSNLIRNRLNGMPKGIIPDGIVKMTCGIDVGKRALHYVVIAWKDGATGSVIDYGVHEVYGYEGEESSDGTVEGKRRAVELAVKDSLHSFREALLAEPYRTAGGKAVEIDATLIDTGYATESVYSFCQDTGGSVFRAAKGEGSGRNQGGYREPAAETAKKLVGNNWYSTPIAKWPILLCHMHSDHWKRFVHERFVTPKDHPGSMTLFGLEPREHMSFSQHVTAEKEVEEFQPGHGLRRKWVVVRRTNHYLDAMYMACVGGDMCGQKLISPRKQEEKKAVAKPAKNRVARRRAGTRRAIRRRR